MHTDIDFSEEKKRIKEDYNKMMNILSLKKAKIAKEMQKTMDNSANLLNKLDSFSTRDGEYTREGRETIINYIYNRKLIKVKDKTCICGESALFSYDKEVLCSRCKIVHRAKMIHNSDVDVYIEKKEGYYSIINVVQKVIQDFLLGIEDILLKNFDGIYIKRGIYSLDEKDRKDVIMNLYGNRCNYILFKFVKRYKSINIFLNEPNHEYYPQIAKTIVNAKP